MMSRVYIAGPITGMPDLNRQAFTDAAARLRQAGMVPLNPHGLVDGWEWSDYMRRALTLLLTADQIMLLPGWWDSRGARLESEVARAVGIPVREVYPIGEESSDVRLFAAEADQHERNLDRIERRMNFHAAAGLIIGLAVLAGILLSLILAAKP